MIIIAVIIIVIVCIIAWYLAPYIGSSGASFLGTLTGTAGGFSSAAAVGSIAVGIAFQVGVSLLITALTMPSAPGSSEATGQAAMVHSGGSTSNTDGSTRSYVFDNLQNDAFQGKPIPIGYGRMKVGSNVIGVSMRTYPLDQLFNNEIAIKNIPVTIYD
jgi:predicted phage tail protein